MGNQLYFDAPDPNLPWDTIRIYHSTDGGVVYSLLVALNISLTDYTDSPGTPTDWYKLQYFDSVHSVMSDFSTPFQVTSVPLLTIRSLRNYVALLPDDPPDDIITADLLSDATVDFENDGGASLPQGASRLALKFIASSYICDWIARHLIRSGAVEFSIDGITIKKPAGIWQSESNDQRKKYEVLMGKFQIDHVWTYPIANGGYSSYSADVSDILHGLNNAYLTTPMPSLGIGGVGWPSQTGVP
jgi:hypothetical protein